MNLREYAQKQELLEPNKATEAHKRLKITLEDKEPNNYGMRITELHQRGYIRAIMAQLSILENFIQAENSQSYYDALTEYAERISIGLDGTEAAELATKLTITTIEYLENKSKERH